jgi:hypothetical protein
MIILLVAYFLDTKGASLERDFPLPIVPAALPPALCWFSVQQLLYNEQLQGSRGEMPKTRL